MAEEIPHPHDSMVHAVLSDLAEATSFLQRYLPEELSQALHWSTLRLHEGSFVDEDLHRSETDFLYQVEYLGNLLRPWRGTPTAGNRSTHQPYLLVVSNVTPFVEGSHNFLFLGNLLRP